MRILYFDPAFSTVITISVGCMPDLDRAPAMLSHMFGGPHTCLLGLDT